MSRKEKDNRPLRFAILTVSNSRTYSDDTNGLLIQSLLTKAGHQVVDYAIVKDDGEAILKHIHEWVCSVDAIVTSGGTGLALRDVTLETLEPKFDTVIPELNGMLTFLAYRRACGTEALAYRSAAGVIRQCPVFCLPGQTSLIKVGTEQLIIPEVHLIKSEISKS